MTLWAVRLGSVAAAFAFCFLLDAFVQAQLPQFYRLVILAGLYVTLAVSLNLINGITGQFSIGHAAFYMVGAYTGGKVTELFFDRAALPPTVWLVLMMGAGALGAAVAGLIVGLPSLRLRGDYLAIVTLGFGEIVRIFVQGTGELGGSYGMTIDPKVAHLWLVWILAVLCIAACRNLLKTTAGIAFLAVREDEVASSAMGVNVTRVKVTAFVVGSMFAGAAGALLAHTEGFITPDMFKMEVSFIILTMVVLGGTGSITGSVLAAIALFGIPEWLRTLKAPDGGALMVPAASVIGAFIAVVLAVAVVRAIGQRYHGSAWRKASLYAGSLVAAYLVQRVLAWGFHFVPQIAAQEYEVAMLRMVIFAGVLIIVMLIRPQGVFAHHEFSWAWVRKVLGGRAAEGRTA